MKGTEPSLRALSSCFAAHTRRSASMMSLDAPSGPWSSTRGSMTMANSASILRTEGELFDERDRSREGSCLPAALLGDPSGLARQGTPWRHAGRTCLRLSPHGARGEGSWVTRGKPELSKNHSSQRTRKIEVADVDHGRDTATPTAAQSAIWAIRLRSSTFAIKRFILMSLSYPQL